MENIVCKKGKCVDIDSFAYKSETEDIIHAIENDLILSQIGEI